MKIFYLKDLVSSYQAKTQGFVLKYYNNLILNFYNNLSNKDVDRDLTEAELSDLGAIVNQGVNKAQAARRFTFDIMQDLQTTMPGYQFFRFKDMAAALKQFVLTELLDIISLFALGKMNREMNGYLKNFLKHNREQITQQRKTNDFLQLFAQTMQMDDLIKSLILTFPGLIVAKGTIKNSRNPLTSVCALQLAHQAKCFKLRDKLYGIASFGPHKALAEQQLAYLPKLTQEIAKILNTLWVNHFSKPHVSLNKNNCFGSFSSEYSEYKDVGYIVANLTSALDGWAHGATTMGALENNTGKGRTLGFERNDKDKSFLFLNSIDVMQVILSDTRLDNYLKFMTIKNKDFKEHYEVLTILLAELRSYLPPSNEIFQSLLDVKVYSTGAILEPATPYEREIIEIMFAVLPVGFGQKISDGLKSFRIKRQDDNTLLFIDIDTSDKKIIRIQKEGGEKFLIQYQKASLELSYDEIDQLTYYYPFFINCNLDSPICNMEEDIEIAPSLPSLTESILIEENVEKQPDSTFPAAVSHCNFSNYTESTGIYNPAFFGNRATTQAPQSVNIELIEKNSTISPITPHVSNEFYESKIPDELSTSMQENESTSPNPN